MTEFEIENILTIFEAELKSKSANKIDDETKQKLNAAHKQIFGRAINMGCSSCVVEGFFELIKRNENQKKSNIMGNNKFELKPGLMPYIGHLKKFVTNKSLTDDLAIEIVKFNSNNAKLFTNPEAILAAVKLNAGATPKKAAATKAVSQQTINQNDNVETVVIDIPEGEKSDATTNVEEPINQTNEATQAATVADAKKAAPKKAASKKPGPKKK